MILLIALWVCLLTLAGCVLYLLRQGLARDEWEALAQRDARRERRAA